MVGCSCIGSKAGVQGGSVLLIGGVLASAGTMFRGCRAGARGGGAVYIDGADAGSLMASYGAYAMWAELVNTALIDNSAEGPGGAVYAIGIINVALKGSVMVNNTAGKGPGGGLAVIGAELMAIKESVVRDNRALTDAGGGASCVSCSSVMVINSTVCGNRWGVAASVAGGSHAINAWEHVLGNLGVAAIAASSFTAAAAAA